MTHKDIVFHNIHDLFKIIDKNGDSPKNNNDFFIIRESHDLDENSYAYPFRTDNCAIMLITEGEEFMYAQPEFQRDLVALHGLLEELTESDVLFEAVSPSEPAQPVTIGRENRHASMQQLSVVRKSFYIGGQEAGVIALVGPTRMNYERGIPLVNYTAKALGDSLTRFFG
jgi:transcriptional regulator of heat shock response